MKNPSPYLKMRVLGAIDYAQGKTIRERIQKVSGIIFADEDGNHRKFTWRTISTWYYRYKNRGITGIQKNDRADKGKTRKITPEELMEAINQALPFFRKGRVNKKAIYRKIIEKGIVRQENLSQTTYYRFIREYDLLDDKNEASNKRRFAFAMQYANQLWQADTMFGPTIKDDSGKMVQSKLITFIDDASRVACHGQFFLSENTDSLVTALKQAFYKRGVPEQLYVDNGSIYTSQEITLICARVGCILRHAPLRDGAAKGKVERFFRTVRDRFLTQELDLSSVEILNRQFSIWMEEKYNASVHSAIGMKPIDRFNMDARRIRFLEPGRFNDELFFAEETRTVKKDNTFSFCSIRYEAPVDLRGRKIQIRFDRFKKDRIVVYYKNERMGEAQTLDLFANANFHERRKSS
jgi:putative transposase